MPSPLLPHIFDNTPDHQCNEIRIDGPNSLDHLFVNPVWNQEYSLKVNSEYLKPALDDKSEEGKSFSNTPSEEFQQFPTAD